jgi:hypothetical protein
MLTNLYTCYSVIYGEQLARKRGSSNDCKSQCTTLFAEQQKFIDRFKIYPLCNLFAIQFCSICCWLQFYNVYLYFLGPEIYEEHHKAWNVNG